MEAEQPKRKPGRPRKNLLKAPFARNGIMPKPNSEKNIVELLYDKPTNFNKIGKYWKSLNTDKIKLEFGDSGLKLFTKNYKGTNNVGIHCVGSQMNHYYCKETISIGVAFSNIEPILNKLDNSYETICFAIMERHKNKLLHIVLSNDVDITESFDIEIFIDPEITKPIPAELFCNDDYDLEFYLPGKYFKKMISDTKQFDKQWTIEKFGLANPVFTYKSGNGQVKAMAVLNNLTDIGFKSRVLTNDIFSVSIYVDTIKPTSSNLLAKRVLIKASKNRALCVWAELDERAVIINTLIDIVDHRNVTK